MKRCVHRLQLAVPELPLLGHRHELHHARGAFGTALLRSRDLEAINRLQRLGFLREHFGKFGALLFGRELRGAFDARRLALSPGFKLVVQQLKVAYRARVDAALNLELALLLLLLREVRRRHLFALLLLERRLSDAPRALTRDVAAPVALDDERLLPLELELLGR